MLRILHAQKDYHGDTVLDVPLLELERGIYWLKGANGSGKTTLLRMIAGMSSFKGDIFCGDISLQKSPVHYRRQVSWADAEPAYPAWLSGSELVSFYQKVRKASPQQIGELVTFFGMQSALSRRIGEYSDGMVKRLSLLLAFIGETALILLDEPLATLDAEAAGGLPDLILRYRQERGTSFLFTSHQPLTSGELPLDGTLLARDRTVQPVI